MNKYEQYYKTTHFLSDCVRALLSDKSAWAGIDEFIARPNIFPVQWMPIADRIKSAKDAKRREGALFVITRPGTHGEFIIYFVRKPPSFRHIHISKLWRNARHESV